MKAILPAVPLAAVLLSSLTPAAAAPAPPTEPTQAWETAFLPTHVKSYAETETVWHLDNQHRLTVVGRNKVQYQQGEKDCIDMQSVVGGCMEHTLGISNGRHFYHSLPSYAKYYKVYANLDLMRCIRPLLQPLTTGKPVRMMMDGSPVLLFKQSQPLSGKPSIMLKTWVDAGTYLSRRAISFSLAGKVPRVLTQVVYSDWKVNPVIPASQFVFVPPAGAKEIAEPYSVGAKESSKPPPPAPAALLTPGTIAPDFAAQTRDGKTVHLSDYKGRVVVLVFWATWAYPCERLLPRLQTVAAQFAPQGVVVLAVDVTDPRDAFDQWLPSHAALRDITFAFDPIPSGRQTTKAYRANAIPVQFVVGKDGKVTFDVVGADVHTADTMRAIAAALKEQL